ncbi:MAG: sugar-binding domain-containing protein [Clostridia bacterium]|nr:sugar-binding domain-containing protein [Clostridia bacterium]MDD4665548.1 sugar-binding domain-containing protein [Clostridia bacterium]
MEAEVYNQSTFLILKAAYLYYLEDKSQNKIADLLNVSVPTVSRLIKKAKEEKIVEFVIRDPYLECIELEEKLKTKYNLRDVIVAPVTNINANENLNIDGSINTKKLVALEGARYIQRIITEKDVLGVTWGKTMYHLIHYLNPCQKVNAAFVTMHGSISCCKNELDVRSLVSRMAMTFGGRNYSLLTEGLLSNTEIVQSIRKEKNIEKVFTMFDKITIAINGLGAFYPKLDSMLSKPEYLAPPELAELQRHNVVGDIALRFIDAEGQECDTELRDRLISIDLETFKKIKKKITIASGEVKTEIVRAAIKGGLVDVLIIDYLLGKSLLHEHDVN